MRELLTSVSSIGGAQQALGRRGGAALATRGSAADLPLATSLALAPPPKHSNGMLWGYGCALVDTPSLIGKSPRSTPRVKNCQLDFVCGVPTRMPHMAVWHREVPHERPACPVRAACSARGALPGAQQTAPCAGGEPRAWSVPEAPQCAPCTAVCPMRWQSFCGRQAQRRVIRAAIGSPRVRLAQVRHCSDRPVQSRHQAARRVSACDVTRWCGGMSAQSSVWSSHCWSAIHVFSPSCSRWQ
jgi:hypothetical protein